VCWSSLCCFIGLCLSILEKLLHLKQRSQQMQYFCYGLKTVFGIEDKLLICCRDTGHEKRSDQTKRFVNKNCSDITMQYLWMLCLWPMDAFITMSRKHFYGYLIYWNKLLLYVGVHWSEVLFLFTTFSCQIYDQWIQ
jgi:hypothetical protein